MGVFSVPRFGEVERNLVGKYNGEVLRQSVGGYLGGQKILFTQTIRRLPGRVMCELGDLVGLTDGRLLIDVETEVSGSLLQRRPH